MKLIEILDGGVALLQTDVFEDNRGSFSVASSESELSRLLYRPIEFVQTNTVRSHAGVARGLHYNVTGRQGKFVYALAGAHFSVAVDVRKDSRPYRRWRGFYLTPDSGEALWVPPGFAHGVLCLTDEGVLQYQSTTPYEPENERSLAIDSDVNIDWPLAVSDMIIAPRDLAVKSLTEFWNSYADR